jgi:hypothetical protein
MTIRVLRRIRGILEVQAIRGRRSVADVVNSSLEEHYLSPRHVPLHDEGATLPLRVMTY